MSGVTNQSVVPEVKPPPNPFHVASALAEQDYKKALAERDKTFEALQLFIDWRHKIMVRLMIAIAAVAAGWHYLTDDQWQLRSALLAGGGFLAAVMAKMDEVNAGQLARLYERGAALERLMFDGVGVFGTIRNVQVDAERVTWVTSGSEGLEAARHGRSPRATYTWLIALLFWSSAATFGVAAISTLVEHFV
jgi:hypothetical protein